MREENYLYFKKKKNSKIQQKFCLAYSLNVCGGGKGNLRRGFSGLWSFV